MSGRLVILRHKSWNVWNQDNQEKVLRDERLHRENEEEKRKQEENLLQEKNLEYLKIQNNSDLPSNELSDRKKNTEEVSPFRLFEDIEKANCKSFENKEYLDEKNKTEHLKKKKDGIADWEFGDGSYEKSGIKPWYEKFPNQSINNNIGIADSLSNNDPILQFSRIEFNEFKEEINQQSSHKKEYPSKDKKRKRENEISTRQVHQISKIQELRIKRLTREHEEKNKANLLLAHHDIYGNPRINTIAEFNIQSNSDLLKNKYKK